LSELGNNADSLNGDWDMTDEALFPPDAAIAVTKFDPTPQRSHLIFRPRLTASLHDQRDARLTLVVAPAGYGKTTLLTEWHRQLREQGLMVGWLTLDADDSDASHVLKCLALALAKAGVSRAAKLAVSSHLVNASVKQHLTTLLNLIAAAREDVILILDEFEHLPQSVATGVFLPLIEKGPANLHLVIASRETPPLPVASLRSLGHLHAVEAEELRFDQSEVQSIFGGAATNRELKLLVDQTSGWPVAVQLLRGVWTNQERRDQVLRDMETLDDTLTDYLSEQVFSSLPQDLFDALVHLSPVDRLSPGIMEFMTGSDGNWSRLLEADALTPFLTPLDAKLKVYRPHPIIRAYFKGRLDQQAGNIRKPVYRRAAEWYASAGRLVSAVSSARLADEVELAGRLIEDAGGLTMWLRSGLPRLQAVVEALDQDIVRAFPRVKLLVAFLRVKEGNVALAREMLEQTRDETSGFEQDRDGRDNAALKLDSLILESTLLVNEGRAASDRYLDQYENTVLRISANDTIFLSNVKNLLAISHIQRGYFDKGIAETIEAIDHYRQAGLIHGEFFARLHMGNAYFVKGEPDKARTAYGAARQLWRSDLDEEKTKLAILNAQTNELAYECALSPPAVKGLVETRAMIEKCEWWYDVFAAAISPLVMTLLETRGLGTAREELSLCRKLVEKRGANGLLPLLEAWDVSCHALKGDPQEAAYRLEKSGLYKNRQQIIAGTGTPWREQEAIAAAVARVLIGTEQPLEAVRYLTPIENRMLEAGHIRSAIRIGTLKTLAQDALGDGEAAQQSCMQVLKSASRTGYVRAFATERDGITGMLDRHGHALKQSGDLDRDECGLIDRLQNKQGSGPDDDKAALSDRERTVLSEVAKGLTDKEIARELGLTPNTVKFHLKNVFRKLGVRNRTEAVKISRDMGAIN
jgi:LuxR family maltose regulon positive regulatory protein